MCSEEEAFQLLDQLELILDYDPLIDEVGYVHPSQLSMLQEEEEEDVPVFSSDSGRREVDEILSSGPSEAVGVTGKNAFYWSREHKLGISMEYLFQLYKAAKRRFMDSYGSYKIHSSFSSNKERVSSSSVSSKVETELMKHSKALLLLSSDFGTAWNARKLIISEREDFSALDELRVSSMVLSFAPKSENAWSYRRWVIKNLAGRCAALEGILEKESLCVEKIAEVLHELDTNKSWAALHVADSSCFHYRRKLMMWLLDDGSLEEVMKECAYQFDSLGKLWKDELDWNELLIRRYIGREALWLHRRFLSVCWVKHFGTYQDGLSQCPSEKSGEASDISAFIDHEVALLQTCTGLPDSIFEDAKSQAVHAAAYILWLKREICWPSSISLDDKLQAMDLRTLLNNLCAEKVEVWNSLLRKESS